MATLEYVLAEALKLNTLDQVKLISTLAHRVEQQIRHGRAADGQATDSPASGVGNVVPGEGM